VKITFGKKELEKCANDDRYAIRKLGKQRALKYKQRLDDLAAGETLEDLRYVPGKFHDLSENRKGLWACSLDEPYRLIMKPHENPVPVDEHGIYIWTDIKGIEIIEIINYHKEK